MLEHNNKFQKIIISFIVLFISMNISFFAGVKMRTAEEKRMKITSSYTHNIRTNFKIKGRKHKKYIPLSLRRKLIKKKIVENFKKKLTKKNNKVIKVIVKNKKKSSKNKKLNSSVLINHSHKKNMSKENKKEESGYWFNCGKRLSSIFSLASQGVIGNDSSNEFDTLYDEKIASITAENSLILKFLDKINLSKNMSKFSKNKLPDKSSKSTAVSNVTSTEKESFNEPEEEILSMATIRDYIFIQTSSEIILLNNELFTNRNELNIFDLPYTQKLPLPPYLRGIQIIKLFKTRGKLFLIGNREIFILNKSIENFEKIKIPKFMRKQGKNYLVKSYGGYLHFLYKNGLFRYNLTQKKWKYYKYDLLFNGKKINIVDFSVDMRKKSFAYWISTERHGLIVMNTRGIMKGALDSIPLKKFKLSLINRPVSIIKNIYGDLYFLINSSENSKEIKYALIFRYVRKKKRFEILKNPDKDIFFYQQLLFDNKNLIFLHDIGCSFVDFSKLRRERKYRVIYDKKIDNIICASMNGRTIYIITYDGKLLKIDYNREIKKYGSDDNGRK